MPARSTTSSTHPLLRPALWAAVAAAVTCAGCAAWKIRTAADLARASEPFQAQPAQPVASLLVIGDSTAVGTGASSPAGSVAGQIARTQPRLRIDNRAADGARYADFARQLQASPQRYDVVLVLGGGNDVIRGTDANELREQVRQVAALARQRGATVVLMPPGNVGNAPFFWRPLSWVMSRRAQSLHAAVREAAQASGARYVNLYKPRGEDPFVARAKELHAPDGLHPSDAGYALWLEELERQAGLRDRLARASAASAS